MREDNDKVGGETGSDERPPRLLTPWFWLALIFGLACVVAGLALAKLGPKYL